MFENIKETALYGANLVASRFAADERAHKIDLGLGMYKDENGITPIMTAVKVAEARVLEQQQSKSYIGLQGDKQFSQLMLELLLGEKCRSDRIAVLQTPGGVAALSLCCHLVKEIRPDAKVWVSDPSWANHVPIIAHTGLQVAHYPYYNATTRKIDFTAMCHCLRTLPRGDVILLQAACHNPTGADLLPEQWDCIAQICLEKELIPLLDVAYQGFGTGLQEDVYGVRKFFTALPELIITATCSKTFSVYRDRAGIAGLVLQTPEHTDRTLSLMCNIANKTYAMPADHAACVVREILSSPELKVQWLIELSQMRDRVIKLRAALVSSFRSLNMGKKFDYLGWQQGMFSRLPLNEEQIKTLQLTHAIYLVDDGRMNVAGLRFSQVNRVTSAIVDVLQPAYN